MQLLTDIAAVCEASDWSTDYTGIARYRTLSCHIKHVVTQSTEEVAADIQEVMSSVQNFGGKVCNVYEVKRTEEEVNFLSSYGNIQTMTHCSGASNFLGILSRYFVCLEICIYSDQTSISL